MAKSSSVIQVSILRQLILRACADPHSAVSIALALADHPSNTGGRHSHNMSVGSVRVRSRLSRVSAALRGRA